ncbi:MAG: DegT/DnrJ/EryC1/StrS aminotransferase family protein [Candidatus Omnitrophica bacterium]|nr:DegT/DnrJ/EryC1/StrS aminotransferase family protein [Candidatus Omnitrophota bacterium]
MKTNTSEKATVMELDTAARLSPGSTQTIRPTPSVETFLSQSIDSAYVSWKLQEQVFSEADLDILARFLRSNARLTQHEKVRQFEVAFSGWQGCKRSVFVNSGSSANLVLVSALKELRGWRDGDEIIVPAVTWPTTITPVLQLGLKPVFADINLNDLSFDYDRLAKHITPRTRAVFVAHLLGFPAEIPRLKDIVQGRSIDILEDCCESLGAQCDGSKVGNLGIGGTFSFYWGHHLTTIEGGMICMDNEDLYKLCLLKRSHGLARELPPQYHRAIRTAEPDLDFKFLFLTDGYNVRNTELGALMGLIQLDRLNRLIARRNRNYARFLAICKTYPDQLITVERSGMSSFCLPFLFRDREAKEECERWLSASGIETRPLISGNLLRQPFLRSYNRQGAFPNADFLHTNAFYIGNNQFVNEERLDVLDRLLARFFLNRSKHGPIEVPVNAMTKEACP